MKVLFMCLALLPVIFLHAQLPADTAISGKEKFLQEFKSLVSAARGKAKWLDKDPVESANNLMKLLLESEVPYQYEPGISTATRRLISERQSRNPDSISFEIYILVLLERVIEDNDTLNIRLKEKLTKAISKEVSLLMKAYYPEYNYYTRQKDIIKFISVRSGNDLFTFAGLFLEPKKENGLFFQPNRDRDYTGSLLVEIGTDYLSTPRETPVKSYQVVLYGFDVYTPYFRDTTIFKTDTSFNKKDRPHASFQYIGWSKKGISLTDKRRWSTTLKLGKIGGHIGEKFQNLIHQDISYSPRPQGWGAQIANNGRFGFSVETRQEFQKQLTTGKGWKAVYSSGFFDGKIGTYMTTAGLGIRLSNKSFRQNNMNLIMLRPKTTVKNVSERLMYSVAFSSNYVIHNTMLEGFGLFKTTERDNDAQTPSSRYYLQHNQVRRINFALNTTASYTTRFFTVFYNWFSFSPETKLGKIGINSPSTGQEMDISKRWHHFAEIGIVFNSH